MRTLLRTSVWWEHVVYKTWRGVPLTDGGEALEDEFPWRKGPCRVFRIPLTRHAIAIGKWTGEQPRETVDGIPLLSFRQLDHPEDFFHVMDEDARLDF